MDRPSTRSTSNALSVSTSHRIEKVYICTYLKNVTQRVGTRYASTSVALLCFQINKTLQTAQVKHNFFGSILSKSSRKLKADIKTIVHAYTLVYLCIYTNSYSDPLPT